MPRGVYNGPRGMACASKETRTRVASMGGRAVAEQRGELFTTERSEKAGTQTLANWGKDFYRLMRRLADIRPVDSE